MPVSPARRAALAAMRRTAEDGAYTDRALRAEADRVALDPRERALATRLAFGAVQRRLTLDHIATALAERDAARLDPVVREILRLGLLQIAFLDGIADHAAVDQSVELAKAHAPRAAGLVNAVLRRATREARGLLEALHDDTPESAAIKHSMPEWIAAMWWQAFGAQTARALLAAVNEPAESAVRANTLVTTRAALAAALPVPSRPAPELPEGLVLDGAFDASGAGDLWEAGALIPQSRAAMLVSRIVDPQPGQRVLDLCAAPGGKTTHLAALMEGSGEVVAVERRPGRAAELRATAARMRARAVTVEVADAARHRDDGPFDKVLVDPPCSGLGTLQGRPDRRWRATLEAIDELVRAQAAILDAAAAAVAPGGTVVYSTCTLSPRENERQVAAFLERHRDFAPDDLRSDPALWEHPTVQGPLLSLPHRDGTDGFFIARLRRALRP